MTHSCLALWLHSMSGWERVMEEACELHHSWKAKKRRGGVFVAFQGLDSMAAFFHGLSLEQFHYSFFFNEIVSIFM